MEEQPNPLPATHLLHHALRSLCTDESSLWSYAVFWRILPRSYPPPKYVQVFIKCWDFRGGSCDKSRELKKYWMLAWEDGFCNFAHSKAESSLAGIMADQHCSSERVDGLQPELFFKMSHEFYNYGEGLIGKVAADHSHTWVYDEVSDQETIISARDQKPDMQYYPRTWTAQFQSGIKTIALIAVNEGVLQLGAVNKVNEDITFVLELQTKFSYLHSIPGFLLPHPLSSTSSAISFLKGVYNFSSAPNKCTTGPLLQNPLTTMNCSTYCCNQKMMVTPSMSSLKALLSKLPSVVPPATSPAGLFQFHHSAFGSSSDQNLKEVNGVEMVANAEGNEEKEHV